MPSRTSGAHSFSSAAAVKPGVEQVVEQGERGEAQRRLALGVEDGGEGGRRVEQLRRRRRAIALAEKGLQQVPLRRVHLPLRHRPADHRLQQRRQVLGMQRLARAAAAAVGRVPRHRKLLECVERRLLRGEAPASRRRHRRDPHQRAVRVVASGRRGAVGGRRGDEGSEQRDETELGRRARGGAFLVCRRRRHAEGGRRARGEQRRQQRAEGVGPRATASAESSARRRRLTAVGWRVAVGVGRRADLVRGAASTRRGRAPPMTQSACRAAAATASSSSSTTLSSAVSSSSRWAVAAGPAAHSAPRRVCTPRSLAFTVHSPTSLRSDGTIAPNSYATIDAAPAGGGDAKRLPASAAAAAAGHRGRRGGGGGGGGGGGAVGFHRGGLGAGGGPAASARSVVTGGAAAAGAAAVAISA